MGRERSMTSSRWVQRVEDNGIVSGVDAVLSLVDSLASSCGADQSRELRRIRLVTQLVEEQMSGRHAESVPAQVLPEIGAELENVRSSLQAALDNAVRGQLIDLAPVNDNIIERLLVELAKSPRSLVATRNVELVLRTVESDAHDVLERVEGDAQSISQEIAGLSEALVGRTTEVRESLEAGKANFQTAIDAKKSEFDTAIEAGKSSFQSTVESGKAEFNSALEAVRGSLTEVTTRVDSLLASQETSFSQLLSQTREQLDESLRSSRDRLDAALAEIDKKATSQSEAAEAASTELIQSIESKKSEAENLVGIIGMTGLVHGYQANANTERRAGFWWRALTIVFGIVGAVVLMIAARHAGQSHASWLAFTAKAAVSAAFGTLAAYSGRVAANHYARASRYRNFELALASLTPYVEPLDDTKKQELLEKLSSGFFGKLDDGSPSVEQNWPSQSSQLVALLQEVVARLPGK
jgi:hypothetical protein